MHPDSISNTLNFYLQAHQSQKVLSSEDQRARGGMTDSYTQSTAWLELLNDLTDGTPVDNGSTAWSMDVSASYFGNAVRDNLEIRDSDKYVNFFDLGNKLILNAYKQRN
jgi:hypothetical protein